MGINKTMEIEKRRRARISFYTEIVLKAKGFEVAVNANLKDISMNGLFVETDKKIPIGTPCDIEIIMTGKSSKLMISAEGLVARQGESGVGIQFHDDLEWWTAFSIYSQYGS
ncbi:MAG: PilZ domain-containing protein [Deltaproteobacteria bacterium]|nr:PilZ domain-containing protein [Deltaproteobacteria bacterium]MBW1718807.1 PilZ domain-containing protein [Deltaproteobacteria bacterium]MBW1937551.1 PilZ domain-containing protein [Deltaproteobacteria bacterium]MBW1964127.1 PilZ domain-containing protein [Deltaproteobacteria bacterium]MBW2079433.1 PilZ domain-containing protein [Deltaproteobacteria bacterium]